MDRVCRTNFLGLGWSQHCFVWVVVSFHSEHSSVENKGRFMWWPVVVFILLIYYFCFVWTTPVSAEKPDSIPEPVPPPPFQHVLAFQNGQVVFRTDQSWTFDLDDSYYFLNNRIHAKDECFGKPNGTALQARGQSLYLYLQREGLYRGGGAFHTHVQEAVLNDHIFYFSCLDNHIDRLSTCPPGQVFDKQSCVSIDVCSDKPDGTVIADSFDKRFYYICPKGLFQCSKGTFFLVDSCRSESSLEHLCHHDPTHTVPINATTFISCLKGRPQVVQCPPGHVLFQQKCVVDTCFQQPDGTRIPFPTEKIGPFRFSTGYYVCRHRQIQESVSCPSEWNDYESKGDHLLFLPQVFHRGKCTVPEFCTNVTSDTPDTVVRAHDFTKNVKNWMHALEFDRAVGYKCQRDQKVLFHPPPGQRIFDFQVSSACDARGKRVVYLGGNGETYFDCDQQKLIPCPPDTFFDGDTCRPPISNAHRYKHMDMFRLNHLAHGWMEPWNYSKEASATCSLPESVYIPGYNVCAHLDCVPFPFLKQLKAHIQLDEWSKCTFRNGKIMKVKTARRKRFNFWTQRRGDDSPCVPGSKIKSGHFLMDSVLYATCDAKQPFVFCPSARTSHIAPVENGYACMPRDDVFESILKANSTETFLDNHVARVVPSPGALLQVNGQPVPANPNGIDMPSGTVKVWSDREARLIFKMLVNHPPNTYFENKQLKAFKNANRIFVTRYTSGSTSHPVDFATYDVEESVSEFQSDAS